MKTKVFSYKGYIGIQSSVDAEGMIAPAGGSNLGCVTDASFAEISEEALRLMKTIPKGRDSIGDIDCFQSGDEVIFGWLGSFLKIIKPILSETARDTNLSLLKSTENVEVPQKFIDYIDSLEKD